jgi:hypothetical protein
MARRRLALLALVAVAVSILALAPAPAAAQSLDDLPFERIGKLTLHRTRRAIAIGPLVGATPQWSVDSGDLDLGVSFGLAVSFFKIPIVPDAETIRELIKERIKARLAEAVKAALQGGRVLGDADLADLGRQIAKDVIDEFLEERRPRRFERPGVRVFFEAARTFDTATWSTRLGVGLGIGPVSLNLTAAGAFGDDTVLYVGPEVSLQAVLGKGPRASVLDLFVRYDLATVGSGEGLMAVGARLILDLL